MMVDLLSQIQGSSSPLRHSIIPSQGVAKVISSTSIKNIVKIYPSLLDDINMKTYQDTFDSDKKMKPSELLNLMNNGNYIFELQRNQKFQVQKTYITSSEKSLITSGIRDRFILSVVTGRVSVTPEVRVVTHRNILHKTPAILFIGAGLAV